MPVLTDSVWWVVMRNWQRGCAVKERSIQGDGETCAGLVKRVLSRALSPQKLRDRVGSPWTWADSSLPPNLSPARANRVASFPPCFWGNGGGRGGMWGHQAMSTLVRNRLCGTLEGLPKGGSSWALRGFGKPL